MLLEAEGGCNHPKVVGHISLKTQLIHSRIYQRKLVIIEESILEVVQEFRIGDPLSLSVVETSYVEHSVGGQGLLVVDPVQVAELSPEHFIPVLGNVFLEAGEGIGCLSFGILELLRRLPH